MEQVIETILPHRNSNIRFRVKRSANGHVAYNLERNGEMAYKRFIPTTKKQLNRLIRQAAIIAEAREQHKTLEETLDMVFRKEGV